MTREVLSRNYYQAFSSERGGLMLNEAVASAMFGMECATCHLDTLGTKPSLKLVGVDALLGSCVWCVVLAQIRKSPLARTNVNKAGNTFITGQLNLDLVNVLVVWLVLMRFLGFVAPSWL